MRDGRLVELSPQLAKFPVRGRKVVTSPRPAWRGLSVDYMTALLDPNARFGFPMGEGGVVVTAVAADTPAARAGIQSGNVITHVGGARVQTPKEFFEAVRGKSGPLELRLWVSAEDRSVRLVDPQ